MSKSVMFLVFLFLVGCLILAGLLQFIAWPVVLFITKSTLVVLLFGTIGGMLSESGHIYKLGECR